ncbi:MAG TPA: DUF2670 domain-containing protein [Candidatus Megaira endosymbiont of Nemacystus decipiens]|nr:DUF2670 domain-containing protein [Candidatus Megaera endosymbiont of Nemacystus decipiens]
MLDVFLGKLKLLLKSPIVIFIYGILSKWYLMVMLSAIFVAFWVFKGLTDIGFMEEAEKTVSKALQDSKSVARYCIPKIMDFGEFWECLQDPPEYESTEEEKAFQKNAEDLLNFEKYDQQKDPYAK